MSDRIAEDIAEIKANVRSIIITLHGSLGDPDSTGLVSRIQDHEKRITAIENSSNKVRHGIWEMFLTLLPWIVAALGVASSMLR
jgi:cephalosporin hydroxylase